MRLLLTEPHSFPLKQATVEWKAKVQFYVSCFICRIQSLWCPYTARWLQSHLFIGACRLLPTRLFMPLSTWTNTACWPEDLSFAGSAATLRSGDWRRRKGGGEGGLPQKLCFYNKYLPSTFLCLELFSFLVSDISWLTNLPRFSCNVDLAIFSFSEDTTLKEHALKVS